MCRWGLLLLGWVSVATGCIQDPTVRCGELSCPAGDVCTAGGCATPEAAAACEGMTDGAPCEALVASVPAAGACGGGACHPTVCGDGLTDPVEACDDGNTIAGDGCSAICDSQETCGNGVIDVIRGEACDDGRPGLSSDGCSSTCKLELATWRNASPRAIASRGGAGIALARARGHLVMFGGYDASGPLGDTWEWLGVWTRRSSPSSPPARSQHVMTEEPSGGVLLFGGSGNAGPLADTWRWNGSSWTQLQPVHSPPARARAAAAYDPVAHRVVLHGGTDGQRALDDTWSWDGTDWTPVDSVTQPTAYDHVLGFDAFNQELVMYGGIGNGKQTWHLLASGWTLIPTVQKPTAVAGAGLAWDPVRRLLVLAGGVTAAGIEVSDVYEWTGTDWAHPLAHLPRPAPRGDLILAFEPSLQTTLLFGGFDATGNGTLFNDTWTWDGADWITLPQSALSPAPRAYAATAYDPRHGKTLLFGGEASARTSMYDDLWEWDERGWTQRAVTPRPAGRTQHALAFDAQRGKLVLFGGDTDGGLLGDTWEWDDTAWTAVAVGSPTAPSPRRGAAMTYDAKHARVVLFGGATVTVTSETWTWDGTAWTKLQPATSPGARQGARMAYDPVRERVVLFGGDGAAATLDDTWEWDGTTWLERTPVTSSPRARFAHAMTYDSQRRAIVVFGGTDRNDSTFGDAWEWDGTAWRASLPQQGIPPRAAISASYDAVHRELVVFGGLSYVQTVLDDTWTLAYGNAAQATEACVVATSDEDGDGLVGCADPDCWGRCAPLCPPGVSCAAGLPHCGDGMCDGPLVDGVEDALLCPADCPPT